MPSTRAISSFERPPANLSATSSRSRGVEPPSAARTVSRRRAAVGCSSALGRVRRPPGRPPAPRGACAGAARRARRCARCRTATPRRAAPGSEAAPLAVGALERLRRDLLGGRRGRAAGSRRRRRRAGRRGGRGPRSLGRSGATCARRCRISVPQPLRSCLNYAEPGVSSRPRVALFLAPSDQRCAYCRLPPAASTGGRPVGDGEHLRHREATRT